MKSQIVTLEAERALELAARLGAAQVANEHLLAAFALHDVVWLDLEVEVVAVHRLNERRRRRRAARVHLHRPQVTVCTLNREIQ